MPKTPPRRRARRGAGFFLARAERIKVKFGPGPGRWRRRRELPAAGGRVESLMKTKRWDLFIVVMIGAVLVLVFVATNFLDLFGLADDGPKAGKGAAGRPEMN